MCKTGIAGWIRRSLLWLRAQVLGIMAGMDQKDCFAVGWLLVTLHLALCFFPCRQAPDALRHAGMDQMYSYVGA